MDVEAEPALASGNVEIEAAIAELDVQPWFGEVVDRAEHLPIDMGADPEAAEIAIRSQTEAVAEVPVIARGDQRIRPAAAGGHAHTGKQTRVERHPRRKSPGAKAEAGIGELQRVF